MHAGGMQYSPCGVVLDDLSIAFFVAPRKHYLRDYLVSAAALLSVG